jgi:copper chaperone
MADMTTRTYAVEGMTCDHCVAAVTTEVGKVPGISDVIVDLEQGTLTVTGDAPRQALADAVDEAGYALE